MAYHQTERAAATDNTRRAIIDSAIALIHSSRRIEDVTLHAIADDAGVALRTVLRHFRSRDGMFEAAFSRIRDTISGNRATTQPGDVGAAIDSLITHYERDGSLNIKALEEEHDIPILHQLLELGRKFHTAWIETVFTPCLPPLSKAQRAATLLDLYAATDVYLWKLLRNDLRKTKSETKAVFQNLVEGCIARANELSKKGHPQ